MNSNNKNKMIEQPKIEKTPLGYWSTIYPVCVEETYEEFLYAYEVLGESPKRAEKLLKRIIDLCGNGHLEAILQLGDLFISNKKHIEGSALIHKAYSIAMEAFPDDFRPKKDRLEWARVNNRLIINTLYAYGCDRMRARNYEVALSVFEYILNLDPEDRKDVRYNILDCLLELDRHSDILNFSKKHSHDNSLEFLYGKFLALYMLNKRDEAMIQLINAKKAYPFIADELIKIQHNFSNEYIDVSLATSLEYGLGNGSKELALRYCQKTNRFWNKAYGIREFISILFG